MIIDRDHFTEMTILPFGVQDWGTDSTANCTVCSTQWHLY